ncbi:patatin-like phospholipase family protein [Gloeothece verrucosa]|uniref:Patatin n=1 Tax=Gloeothece verrucosa (strain PCC 7822) TaxID=497965 RepID=E0UGC0_GLOV7|nr:patatin-like phospholipase family protein [Gloeothece verrucosa]ADN16739.1 Patatin [Gloeothece verrucosa PCC 7822]
MTNAVAPQLVLTFDGLDDYIAFGKNDLGGVFAQGNSSFTISGWVNPLRLTNKATTYGTRNVFFSRSSDQYSDNFELGISEEGNLDVYIDEKVKRQIKTLGNGELSIGQWHFFALVFNQGLVSVFLDDHQYSDSLTGSSLNKATSPVTLGATLHNQVYFNGQLANISVWKIACTAAEIERHRSGLIEGNEEGLIAYWKLNEGEGTSVRNASRNAFHGKLHGNPTWDTALIPFTKENREQGTGNREQGTGNREQGTGEGGHVGGFPDISEPPNPKGNSVGAGQVPLPTPIENDEGAELDPSQSGNLSSETPLPLLPQAEELDPSQSGNLSSETPLPLLPQAEETQTAPTPETEVSTPIESPEPIQTLTEEESQKTMNTTAKPKYRILSIDGGGIRGIIPAIILAEIEKRTQKPISSLFDLIAGTSSGGILALGLTKPHLNLDAPGSPPTPQYSAEDLLELFVKHGAEIFYEPFFEKILGSLEDIFTQPKYSPEGRETIIKEYFGQALLENNLKEVFVTSYDIEQRIPIFFTNKLEKQETQSRRFRKLCLGFTLADAALATTATPTFFPPYHIVTSHNSNGFYTLVDGGVVANNPANLAILEAKISNQTQNEILHTEDLLLVSLGTGSLTTVYPYDAVKNWGTLQWSRPLLNIVFDGGSEVTAGQLERLFEAEEKKNIYYRFQTFLTGELEEIDNAKLDNIRRLQELTHRLITEKSPQIDELCSILSS